MLIKPKQIYTGIYADKTTFKNKLKFHLMQSYKKTKQSFLFSLKSTGLILISLFQTVKIYTFV